MTLPFAALALLWFVGCGPRSSGTPAPSATAQRWSGPPRPSPAETPPPKPPLQVRIGETEGIAYLESVLGDAREGDALPMVIAVHGVGYRPRIPEDDMLTWTQKMRLIVPRAPLSHQGGYAWFLQRFSDKNPDALAKGIASAALGLGRAIAAWTRQYPTQGRPILLGFSQGGMLTLSLALHQPQLLSVALPLASHLPPPLFPTERPRETPRIVSMHSRDDRVIPIEPARATFAALSAQGWSVEFREFDGAGHEMSEAMKAMLKTWVDEAAASQAKEKLQQVVFRPDSLLERLAGKLPFPP